MTNDEHFALELHKQLNAIPLRRRERRGPVDPVQLTLDRLKEEKQRKQGTKRTTSSSQDHPSSRRRRRNSDPDGDGPTSSHHIRREPAESNQSHPGHEQHAHCSKVKVEPRAKQCDSRDSGMHPAAQRQLDHLADIQKYSPGQAAALSAAQTTRQQLKPPPDGAGPTQVKVFYAGVRWGLSLPPSAVKTRQLLAQALNVAFVGDILSVGQGRFLSAVFLDVSGSTEELGPVEWRDAKKDSEQWTRIAKSASRIYVRGPQCLHKVVASSAKAL